MGLRGPLHPQLSYPVSLVNVTHREPKCAAVTSAAELWGKLKKEFVPLGGINENFSRKILNSVFVRAFLTLHVKAQHCSQDSSLEPGGRTQ